MTEFLARVGDRINPIVVKETRQAVNSRLVASFLLIFLAVQLVVMLLMITGREFDDPNDLNLRAGRELFTFVQGILLGACMILIPTMTGVRLAVERSDVNVDLLFISSLTPRAVLFGKLFAAGALALLIFSACAPFMTFAYVMRGLDVPTILLVLFADYLAVITGTVLSLFLASVPANRILRAFLGVAGFAIMCYLGGGLMTISSNFLRYGSGYEMESWEFWLGCFGLTALILGINGLLFVWSVALISPPAANRAFWVRVYTLVFWIGTALGFGAWSLYSARAEVMIIWGVLSSALFSLQIIIAVCERDEWGTRVARRIPQRPLLRLPAFFLYSGATGGVAFGVVGAVLSVIGFSLWFLVIPPRYADLADQPVALAGLLAGYTYCYCLTAAVARRLLRGTAFRIGYTWVIGAVLLGIGIVVPYFAHYVLFDRSMRYGSDEMIGLFLPNPFVMIDDATRHNSHIHLTILFLVVWGGAVTAINAVWFARQLAKFHPPKAEGADE